MKRPFKTRRNVIAGLVATLGGIVAYPKIALTTNTPSASEGPFYPTPAMRLADVDNDLVKIAGQVRQAGGEIIQLKGLVTDRDGTPQSGVRVEIWQCDMNGTYMHPGDNRGLSHDPAFQGFGHDLTDAEGTYRFRTLKPTSYPGRAPHIHVKVLRGETELLTTQFYIKDHVANSNDFLFRRMSAKQREQVEMVFVGGGEAPATTLNIIL